MNFNFTLNPRHWFQKRTPALAAGWAESRNRMRYNALFMLDPDVLVRNLGMFAAGDIAGMERILEEFEARDDKMKVGSFKMAAAVASKPWEVRIAKGEEDNPAAKRHQEVLTRFWNRITVTDAFCRNRRGGLRTLVKQMMLAQSRVYAVHDVSWAVRPDGELEATFTQVPAWNFENRSGELRYLRDPGAYTGVEMKDGEWLVTVGEGVGVTAAILAMAKRLSWNDWLLFSEKCGMPVILGNTGAKEDTPAWNALMAAIKAIAPKTGLLADVESKIQAVPFGGSSGTVTYKELVETVDRAISALYRGGDLATMSKGGDGVGTNAQDGESELMDADGCAMVSETLNRQIERHVVRFTCGDFEPLAGIVLNPPAETEDVDREIKIDMHLAGLGVKLSKADALARYGRTEAEDEDDALQLPQAPQNGLPGGMGALPNEETAATPFKTPETPFKNPPSVPGAQGDGKPADASRAVLDAFAKDTSKAAEAVKNLLDDPTPEKAQALLDDLPSLIPDDPALAAVIAEEMAKEFKSAVQSVPSDALANENPYHCPKCGKFSGFNGHCDKCGYTLDAGETQKRAERMMKSVFDGDMTKPVEALAYRDGLGQIDLDVGKLGVGKDQAHGSGLSKLDQKHPREIRFIPQVVAHGKIYRLKPGNDPQKPFDDSQRAIVYGTKSIFLERKDSKRWTITSIYDNLKKVELIERAAAK